MASDRWVTCPMEGCGAPVSVPAPAGVGPNRWTCPGCNAVLEYSVSTGRLTPIAAPRSMTPTG